VGRIIEWPRVQKPGLAMAGFLPYVRPHRVQILGESEFTYLATLTASVARKRIEAFTSLEMSCVIVTKGITPPSNLRRLCSKRNVPLFTTPRLTGSVIESLTAFLEESLAPRATVHGVLLEVGGLGTLLLGDSGVGKSECALALVQRGHRLVADDLVVIKRFPADVLIGSSSGLVRHHMELRGLGIVNVPMLFGVTAVLERHSVEFVIHLTNWIEGHEYDRLGLDEETETILGVGIPKITMPVATGRDLAMLVEIAVRNQILKNRGFHAAREMAARVQAEIAQKTLAAQNAQASSKPRRKRRKP
ncbi:MAG: HPr(Ser) kinase/phosphatase, partial [Acidobacteria bacterium]|nr:HPr(Ser) kinase/phosphatase [Acidobacteriota bacterium]